MRESGLNLQLMAVYIPPHITRHQGTVTALWIAQFAHRACESMGSESSMVLTKGDLDRAVEFMMGPIILLFTERKPTNLSVVVFNCLVAGAP